MRAWMTALTLAWLLMQVSAAHAEAPAPSAPAHPSVFRYAFRGLLVGSLAGLSASYLAIRRDGFERADWKPVSYGLGFGALGGATLGLTLGLIDSPSRGNAMAALALRDMAYGSGLGALLGAVLAAPAAVAKRDAEKVGFGAAIGVLSGCALGLVTGVIAGAVSARSEREQVAGQRSLRARPTVLTAQGAGRGPLWLAGAEGRF